jgi:predicted nucleic acid-binding protein
MNLYLDSSALGKGNIAESHSAEVVALVDRAEVAATSWAIPEVLSALILLQRSGDLQPVDADGARAQFMSDSERY